MSSRNATPLQLIAAATPLPPSPTPMDTTRPRVTARRQISPSVAVASHRPRVILPDFWVAEPRLWFRRAEAIFRSEGVSASQQKYDHILARLPNDVLVTVLDLVDSLEDTATATNPYKQLRDRLVSAFSPSKWHLANRLLQHPSLGDQKPSVLMDKMLALLPAGEPAGVLFQSLFLNRLPEHIRDHLVAQDFTTIRDMAAHADRLWAARNAEALAATLAALRLTDRRRSVSPTSSRRSSPGHTPGRRASPTFGPPPNKRFCHFHRFGAEARLCRAPCAWQAENARAAGGL